MSPVMVNGTYTDEYLLSQLYNLTCDKCHRCATQLGLKFFFRSNMGLKEDFCGACLPEVRSNGETFEEVTAGERLRAHLEALDRRRAEGLPWFQVQAEPEEPVEPRHAQGPAAAGAFEIEIEICPEAGLDPEQEEALRRRMMSYALARRGHPS